MKMFEQGEYVFVSVISLWLNSPSDQQGCVPVASGSGSGQVQVLNQADFDEINVNIIFF